jgi:hypothetical protein
MKKKGHLSGKEILMTREEMAFISIREKKIILSAIFNVLFANGDEIDKQLHVMYAIMKFIQCDNFDIKIDILIGEDLLLAMKELDHNHIIMFLILCSEMVMSQKIITEKQYNIMLLLLVKRGYDMEVAEDLLKRVLKI